MKVTKEMIDSVKVDIPTEQGAPEIKEIRILIDGPNIAIEMKGGWTRRLIDATYTMMLKKLATHLAQLRGSIATDNNPQVKEGE